MDPTTKTVNVNQSATLTATVLDGKPAPVALMTVSFEIVTAGSGSPTLRELNFVTDADGKARVTYTAGATGSTQDVIRARVYGDAGSILAADEVFIAVGGGGAYALTISASPATLAAAGGQSVVTANVKNAGVAVSGVTVNFSIVAGGSAGGSVSPAAAITDGSGNAVATYQGGAAAATGDTDTVQAGITVGGNTYGSAVVICNAITRDTDIDV